MTWLRIHSDFSVDAEWRTPSVVCTVETAERLKAAWAKEAGVAPIVEQPADQFTIDLGGICFVDRKIYSFDLDGLKVSIPATDVGAYLDEAPDEVDEDLVIRSMFGWHLIVSKDQYVRIKAWLESIMLEAAAVASAENERFNDRIVGAPGVAATPRPVKSKIDA